MILRNFQARIHQQFLHEWVAYLNRRTISRLFIGKITGCKTGTIDTITPGFGTDINQRITDSRRFAFLDLILIHNADTHRIDQWIAGIGMIKIGFSADRGNADCVPITTDTGHDAIN